jgi:PAS domain-containing protein
MEGVTMSTTLFDSAVIQEASEAMDFMANILEASAEYSIIGKNLDGKILLWNKGARRMYSYESEEVVGKANAAILYAPEDITLGKSKAIMNAGTFVLLLSEH